MAVELRPDQARVAHVVRAAAGRPRLALRAGFDRAGSDADDLARLRRSLGLQHYRCTTSIDSSAYQIVALSAPAVSAAELNAALRWGIKDSLDFPAEDAMIESLGVPRDGVAPGRPASILAVAARRDRVGARVEAFQRSRVPLKVIDVAETAQRNLAALFEQGDRGLAFLSFTDKGGLLTFTRRGELYALRRIDVAASALADDAPAEVREQRFERIALELQRSLDNFDRLFSQVALQGVLVAPHQGREALVAYLRDNLALPVEPADLDSVVDCDEDARFANVAEQADWLHVVGLALREEAAA